MRVAAVDLGTNSTRLLVADVDNGAVREVARRLKITRLGEGVDERRRLLPAPIARVRNVLTDFRREAERLGAERALAIATSAVRDAENGEAFLGEIEWSYGFATRLLTGDEEAELSFRGAALGRELDEDTLLLDIGGGSTELVVGTGAGVDFHVSTQVGVVRHSERHLHADPAELLVRPFESGSENRDPGKRDAEPGDALLQLLRIARRLGLRRGELGLRCDRTDCLPGLAEAQKSERPLEAAGRSTSCIAGAGFEPATSGL